MDAPGNDGNMSMPEQVKRPNPWRKMMMNLDDSLQKPYVDLMYCMCKDQNKLICTNVNLVANYNKRRVIILEIKYVD